MTAVLSTGQPIRTGLAGGGMLMPGVFCTSETIVCPPTSTSQRMSDPW
jgi:hypothetical protein